VRASGPIASRATLVADALTAVRDDIGRQPLAPLPTLDEVTGATTRKPLGGGDVVTRSALIARPLVASGDEVVTVARVGALEVRGRAIAAQSGGLGDTVIVVNPDSRKRLHARVVAGALVEVRHGS
jgi:flagella basal body P-ring formation protein FlgA